MLEDNDDRAAELANLLADEDRVRDVLLAALDGELMPPVRTDLADIVQRGKRRARLQVVAASVAAVVLIAAVALGATVLARFGGPNRVSSAGPSTSLPVTSQTLTTTANPPSPNPSVDFGQAACIYPGLATGQKWLPLNTKQAGTFVQMIAGLGLGPMASVRPEFVSALPTEQAREGVASAEIYRQGNISLVTISTTVFSGSATAAANLDGKQDDMPETCIGRYTERMLGKTPLINEYTPEQPYQPGVTNYVRVRLYDSRGIRYDVTEAVNPTGVPDYVTPQAIKGEPPDTSAKQGSPYNWPPALTGPQLAQIAIEIDSMS